MKLISCYIENFGKLKDQEIFFDSGQSVIFEENGWGKSTLAAFIKVMFFGFDHEGKHDETLNERRRYLPWGNGIYGGRLVFETGGREYRLERTFGEKRNGTDTFALYDHETNHRYNLSEEQAPGGNLGEALFGIDSRSFQRTVMIRQLDSAAAEATAEIGARIGRVSNQVADMGNYETVRANLEKERNRLTPKRKTGQISRLKLEVAELTGIVRGREGHLKELEQIEQTVDHLKAERQARQEEQKAISVELQMIAKIHEEQIQEEQYRNLLKAEADAKERMQHERNEFSEHPPSLSEVDEQIKKIRECGKLRVSLQSRRDQAELLGKMVKSGREEDEPGSLSISGLLLIAGILLLVSGVILGLMDHLRPGILLSVVGITAAALWWYLYNRDDNSVSGSTVEVDGYKAAEVRYTRLMEDIKADERKANEIEQKTRSFLFRFGGSPDSSFFDDPESVLQDLKQKVMNFQLFWDDYQKKKAERETFEETHDLTVWEREDLRELAGTGEGTDSFLLQEKAEELSRKQSESEEISEEIWDQELQEEAVLRRLAEIEQAEVDLREKEKEINILQHRYDVISRTMEYLEQAKTRFSARYMGTVRTSFERYYRMISGNDGMEYEMDADFNVTLRAEGSLRDVGYLSEGYRDLVGLCLRMAMIDAMYDQEKPFLIFDDPFVSLDDQRLDGALRFLDMISEEYQVIYFSCSEARLPA